MRFQTPQFIEIEDKIFGPLTIKQFVYLVGGAGLSVLIYLFMPLLIALPLILVVISFSLALAFFQINGRPFIQVLEAGFRYLLNGRLYLWKKREKKPSFERQRAVEELTTPSYIPTTSTSNLTNLSWNLTVEDRERGEEEKSLRVGIE